MKMKKLGYALAFVLLCTIMLTVSVGALWVGSTYIDSTASSSGQGWVYDGNTKTLTLNNFILEHKYEDGKKTFEDGISSVSDLTVVLKGNNTISAPRNGLMSDESLTIEGEGKLTIISAGTNAIYTKNGNIAINGGQITVKSADNDGVLAQKTLSIAGENTKVTVENAKGYGIRGLDGINISDKASVTITSANQNGIYSDKGSISLTDGSSATITKAYICLHAPEGTISLENSTVTIAEGYCGLFSKKALSLDNSTVTIEKVGTEALRCKSGDISLQNGSTLTVQKSGGHDGSNNRHGIYTSQNVNIDASTVTITEASHATSPTKGMYVTGNLTITNGSTVKMGLNGKINDNGLYAEGTITIDGTNTTVEIDNVGSSAIYGKGGVNIAKNANVIIHATGEHGLYCDKDITIDGSEITVISAAKDGIHAVEKVTIQDKSIVEIHTAGQSGICGLKGIFVTGSEVYIATYKPGDPTSPAPDTTGWQIGHSGFYASYDKTDKPTVTLTDSIVEFGIITREAIRCNGDLEMRGSEVNIRKAGIYNNNKPRHGIHADRNILVNDSTVILTEVHQKDKENSKLNGMYATGDITIENGSTVQIALDIPDTANPAVIANAGLVDNDCLFAENCIYIRGENTSVEIGNVTQSGMFSSNGITISDDAKVTVKNAGNAGIYSDGSIRIIDNGTVTVAYAAQDGVHVGKNGASGVTLTIQDGTVDIWKTGLSGIYSFYPIKLENATITIGSDVDTYIENSGIYTDSSLEILDCQTIDIGKVSESGVRAFGGLTIQNSTVTVEDCGSRPQNDPYHALGTSSGDIHIINSTITVAHSYQETIKSGGNLWMQNSNVTVTDTDMSGLSARYDIQIENSYVDILHSDEAPLSKMPILTNSAIVTETETSIDINPANRLNLYSEVGSLKKPLTNYATGATTTLPTEADFDFPAPDQFMGWFENEDFSGSRVTEIVAADDATEEITLYAKWYSIISAPHRSDVSKVLPLLASQDWTVRQAIANTNDELVAWIAEQMQEVCAPYGVTATVRIDTLNPAEKGKYGNPEGNDGSFRFTVTLSKGTGETYYEKDVTIDTGIITATAISKTYSNWHHSLAMLFSQQYPITATTTDGGTITDEGITEVFYDRNHSYTITPDDGYEIVSVLIDGEDIGAVEKYTFKRVKEEHTIHIIFQPIAEEAVQE